MTTISTFNQYTTACARRLDMLPLGLLYSMRSRVNILSNVLIFVLVLFVAITGGVLNFYAPILNVCSKSDLLSGACPDSMRAAFAGATIFMISIALIIFKLHCSKTGSSASGFSSRV